MIVLSLLKSLIALKSDFVILGGGVLALFNIPTMVILVFSASPDLTFLKPSSTDATISGTGILVGVGAKFKRLVRFTISKIMSIPSHTELFKGIYTDIPRGRVEYLY